MDAHKQLSQMDPKLKEAYERVMGGTTPPPQSPQTSAAAPVTNATPVTNPIPVQTPSVQQNPAPATPANGITHTADLVSNTTSVKPILQTVEVTTPAEPQPAVHPISPQQAVASENVVITNPHPAASYVAPPPQPAHTTTGTVHIGYGAKPGQKVNIEKKKLNIPPALYIVGCIVFFMLYTVFWIKVFNIPLPFLP